MTKEEIIKAAEKENFDDQERARVLAAKEILKDIDRYADKIHELEKELTELPTKEFNLRQNSDGQSSFRFNDSSIVVSGNNVFGPKAGY